MTRTALNFIIDVLTLILILSLAATGLLLRYVLPPGSRGGSGLSLWGWTRHDWGDIHFWIAAALAVLLVLHVALHWNWVCATLERWMRGDRAPAPVSSIRRNAAGAAFFAFVAVIVSGFVAVAWTAREAQPTGGAAAGAHVRAGSQARAGPARGRDARADPSVQIRGSMTLADLERETGVPADVVREELGLPPTTSLTARLGELRRRYNFELSAVRRIVSQHRAEPARQPGE